ncbi:MAG: hypothetical protein IKH26_07030 [Bacteroidaceae bacterium]|nr:hypothetical protein [Bacteroidaceae bacterium]
MEIDFTNTNMLPEEVLDRILLIGKGWTIRDLLDKDLSIMIPLDDSSLNAPIICGGKWSWRDFLDDNLIHDFQMGGIPVKRLKVSVSRDRKNNSKVWISAYSCNSVCLYKNRVNLKLSSVYWETEKKWVNRFLNDEIKRWNDNQLNTQLNYLKNLVNYNAIIVDTNILIWIGNDGKMKYERMLSCLGKIQWERATSKNNPYGYEDFFLEVHNAVYSEINRFSKRRDDQYYSDQAYERSKIKVYQPANLKKEELQKMAIKAKKWIEQNINYDKSEVMLTKVGDIGNIEVNHYADKWIVDYTKEQMTKRSRRILLITNDRDLRIETTGQCENAWISHNEEVTAGKKIGRDFKPSVSTGDVIMKITEQIDLITNILSERKNNLY